MKFIISTLLMLCAQGVWAYDIISIGTSNTNCVRASRDQTYPAQLEKLLRNDGIDVHVRNEGINGDKPANMYHRLKITENTKLVIFEPGPNELNKQANVEGAERVLARLKELKIPTIYVSHRDIQKYGEAEETAKKYGAYYYGHWDSLVTRNSDYVQYDGHLTGKGCQVWGGNMYLFVKDILVKENIK